MKLTIVLVTLLCWAGSTSAQTSGSIAGAEQRAKEIIQLINANNRAEYQKYVNQNFGGTFRTQVPMERHLDFYSSVQDGSRGLEIQSLKESAPNQVTALVKSKLTGGYGALVVSVEPEAPYRIVRLGMRDGKPPAGSSPARKLTNAQITQELGTLVRKLADADVFSGTVLLAKDGVPIYKAAYGIANKDFNVPNRIDTKFNLGSMNKMFTAVAIAQLVERGKLSFEDPLSKFIPGFPDKESAEKIKIKHLLSHTAGLGGYFSRKWQESSRDLYHTVDDMMKRLAEDEKKVQFEPGSRWQYSNSGMLVLGKVIEVASGQSYYDYVRENIYKPAGMINTDCYELDKVNSNLAVGYAKQYTDTGYYFTNNIFAHVLRGGPQGGGYSTVEDLLKFDLALRSNKLVGAEYVKILTTPKPELQSPGYGFGFQVDRDVPVVGHSGGFIGISSNLDMFVGTGWTAIVMSNYGDGTRQIEGKMRELVLAGREGGVASR